MTDGRGFSLSPMTARFATVIVTFAVLFAAVPAATAAPNGTYRGETSGERNVKLRVERNRIMSFASSLQATCYTGDRVERFVYPPRGRRSSAGRLKADGSFVIVFKGNPDVSFNDDKRVLKGKFSGGRVTGTMRLRGLCSADITFSAKRG